MAMCVLCSCAGAGGRGSLLEGSRCFSFHLRFACWRSVVVVFVWTVFRFDWLAPFFIEGKDVVLGGALRRVL